MKKNLSYLCLLLVSSVSMFAQSKSDVSQTAEQIPADESDKSKTVAIFVRNDSGKQELNDSDKALEFALSSRLNNAGFAVVNQDLVLRNLNDYLKDPNAEYRSAAEKFKRNLESEKPDAKLFQNASGLRIGEFLGVDYLISVSISGLGKEVKSFEGYGVKTSNILVNLRSNYNLYEGGMGAGSAGGSVKAVKTVRDTSNSQTLSDDVINELLDDTAEKLAVMLEAQNRAGQIAAKTNAESEITIEYSIADMSLPNIEKEGDAYVVKEGSIPATIPYVTAEIDGVAQTLGGKISLSKGIHILRITQKDIEPIQIPINITGKKDQVVKLALQLNDEARNRWKTDLLFIESVKDRVKASEERRMLTEAEVAKILGIAKMFEQSGFKIDLKELPEIHQSQGIFAQ